MIICDSVLAPMLVVGGGTEDAGEVHLEREMLDGDAHS